MDVCRELPLRAAQGAHKEHRMSIHSHGTQKGEHRMKHSVSTYSHGCLQGAAATSHAGTTEIKE
eukprot:1160491-Pelagomonas_calceolata.AAC.3